MSQLRSPSTRSRLALAFCHWLCVIMICHADWRTDSGYFQLSTELGAAMPTGAGIIVLQTEAGGGMPQASSTSPFAGTGNYTGKTFTTESSGMTYANHANSVATNFYGNSSSAAPGVTDVHLMDADGFFNAVAGSYPPSTAPGSVHNHSWIGVSTGSATIDNNALRAFDYQINRDGLVSSLPLNNGTGALPTFMANAYNGISVGLRNGSHSLGGSTADGIGRMKPDLVVNESQTSYAAPAVASVAAMLRQTIKASYSAADRPQVIKAILLAGAAKTNLPGWQRTASTAPYDGTFGAGELNALNAYHVLVKGQQVASSSAAVSSTGWDYGTAQSSSVKRYFFTIPAGSFANTFSAALTWHRTITHIINYNSSLPNLTLKLYAASGLVVGALIDQSNSTLDNVQHVFRRNLPSGQYAIEVSSGTNNVNYGLAWQTQTGSGPVATVRLDSSALYLDLTNLDPFATYTIQTSPDLVTWTAASSVRTADTTPSTTFTWQDSDASAPARKFYRLQWTAVR